MGYRTQMRPTDDTVVVRVKLVGDPATREFFQEFYDLWWFTHMTYPPFLLVAYRDTLHKVWAGSDHKTLSDIVNIFIKQSSRPVIKSMQLMDHEVVFKVESPGTKLWWDYLIKSMKRYTFSGDYPTVVFS